MDDIRNRYITKILIYLHNSDNSSLDILVNNTNLYLEKINDGLYFLDCYLFNASDIIEIKINDIDIPRYPIIIDDDDEYMISPLWYSNILELIDDKIYDTKDSENVYSIFNIYDLRDNTYAHGTNVTLFLEKKYYKIFLVKYINILNNDILNIIKHMLFNILK